MIKRLREALIYLFSILLTGISFLSCSREEPVPAYIHIEKIDVTSDLPTQGTASHNVVDAWVYVDENPVGAFELPVTFPVIASEGTHTVKIRAGIKVDGISALRSQYPFYDFYTATVTLTPAQVTTLTPTVNYFQDIVMPAYIPWYDDMENAGVTLKDDLSEVSLQIDTVDEFEGNQSVIGTFASGDTTFYWQSQDSFLLSTAQNAIYLELNYKCGTGFDIGLKDALVPNVNYTFLSINPSSEWKKIYINLGDKLGYPLLGTRYYYVYFSKLNVDQSANGYSIQLDNIKLLKN